MGYDAIHDKLSEHLGDQAKRIREGRPRTWFTDSFGSLSELLQACDSASENSAVTAGYKTDPYPKRVKDSLKLDYVCALRREIRRQYISGQGDPFTDVTPLRYNHLSMNQAMLFDNLLKEMIDDIKDNA